MGFLRERVVTRGHAKAFFFDASRYSQKVSRATVCYCCSKCRSHHLEVPYQPLGSCTSMRYIGSLYNVGRECTLYRIGWYSSST